MKSCAEAALPGHGDTTHYKDILSLCYIQSNMKHTVVEENMQYII